MNATWITTFDLNEAETLADAGQRAIGELADIEGCTPTEVEARWHVAIQAETIRTMAGNPSHTEVWVTADLKDTAPA